MMDEAQDRYWFGLVGPDGEQTELRFPTYRMAYQRGQLHGNPAIWYWDGEKDRPVAHIEGQEALGIGW